MINMILIGLIVASANAVMITVMVIAFILLNGSAALDSIRELNLSKIIGMLLPNIV